MPGVHQRGVLRPEQAVLGLALFGVPVLMILSAMTVTGDEADVAGLT